MSETKMNSLDAMSREELIARARELSINRPELMTRVELRDEIVRLTETDEERRRRARGWLGVARDLVASVVEQRLNLPDAAELIRNANIGAARNVPPVATVTLAEIYAAQGHVGRAIKLLDEVLLREPDHAPAAALRATLIEQQAASKVEPAVRQSDMPEPRDGSEGWEGDPLEHESGDTTTSEAEALAAVETVSESRSKIDATDPEVSTIVSTTSVSSTKEEPGSRVLASEQPQTLNSDQTTDANEPSMLELQATFEQAPTAQVIDVAVEVSARAREPEAHADDPTGESSDAMLLYRRSGPTLVCHWEIDVDTWEQLQTRGDGEWIVRVFQVRPVAGPLDHEERDVPLPGMSGEVLFDVEPSAHVRMAAGWRTAVRFEPVVIGIEIAGDTPEALQLAWLPLPSVGDPPSQILLQHARRCWRSLAMDGA